MLAPRNDEQSTEANPGDAADHVEYRGYLVDLLDAMSKHASFTYSLRAVADRQRGGRRPDGSWTGLVGELVAGVCMYTVFQKKNVNLFIFLNKSVEN